MRHPRPGAAWVEWVLVTVPGYGEEGTFVEHVSGPTHFTPVEEWDDTRFIMINICRNNCQNLRPKILFDYTQEEYIKLKEREAQRSIDAASRVIVTHPKEDTDAKKTNE